MGTFLTLGHSSDTGRVRSNNEDAYCALIQPYVPAGIDALLAVADGMGGHQAGEMASRLAIERLIQRIAKSVVPGDSDQYNALLNKTIHQLDAVIRRKADRPETHGMGTTLTVALLAGSSLSVAHVGDSRAYLWRQGNLRQLTQDHSWVAEQVSRGVLSPEEARAHPKKNVLTRALGFDIGRGVDSHSLLPAKDDVILLCSDGLHSLLSDQEISRFLEQLAPQDACDQMVAQANSRGGKDNITVVIARIDELCD
jgi:serine/threonine protein phosphatase PrpC